MVQQQALMRPAAHAAMAQKEALVPATRGRVHPKREFSCKKKKKNSIHEQEMVLKGGSNLSL